MEFLQFMKCYDDTVSRGQSARATKRGGIGTRARGRHRRRAQHAESDDDDDDDDDLKDELNEAIKDDDEEMPSGLFKFNSQSKRAQPLRDWLVAARRTITREDDEREALAEASGMTRAGGQLVHKRQGARLAPMVLKLGEELQREADARPKPEA